MRIMDLALVVLFFIASAGVTAFVMAAFIHYGLGVAPAALRSDALISASLLGLLLAAVATTRKRD